MPSSASRGRRPRIVRPPGDRVRLARLVGRDDVGADLALARRERLLAAAASSSRSTTRAPPRPSSGCSPRRAVGGDTDLDRRPRLLAQRRRGGVARRGGGRGRDRVLLRRAALPPPPSSPPPRHLRFSAGDMRDHVAPPPWARRAGRGGGESAAAACCSRTCWTARADDRLVRARLWRRRPPPSLTLFGRGFAPLGVALRCRFGPVQTSGTFVSTGDALRRAEDAGSGSAAVSASIDGGADFGAAAPAPRSCTTACRRLAAVPSFVDGTVGGPIVVLGTNLAPTAALACVFEQVGHVAATMLNSSAVRCVAPPLPSTVASGWTQLRLTLDGSLLSPDALPFIFHDATHGPHLERATPDAVPVGGAGGCHCGAPTSCPGGRRSASSAAAAAGTRRRSRTSSTRSATCAPPDCATTRARRRCGSTSAARPGGGPDAGPSAAARRPARRVVARRRRRQVTLCRSRPTSRSTMPPRRRRCTRSRRGAARSGPTAVVVGANFAPTDDRLRCAFGAAPRRWRARVARTSRRSSTARRSRHVPPSLVAMDVQIVIAAVAARLAPPRVSSTHSPPPAALVASLSPVRRPRRHRAAGHRDPRRQLRADGAKPPVRLRRHRRRRRDPRLAHARPVRRPARAASAAERRRHVRHDGLHWSARGERLVLFDGTSPPQAVRADPGCCRCTRRRRSSCTRRLRPTEADRLLCRFASSPAVFAAAAADGAKAGPSAFTAPATFGARSSRVARRRRRWPRRRSSSRSAPTAATASATAPARVVLRPEPSRSSSPRRHHTARRTPTTS